MRKRMTLKQELVYGFLAGMLYSGGKRPKTKYRMIDSDYEQSQIRQERRRAKNRWINLTKPGVFPQEAK
jgi:hypothetical protein